MYSQAKVIAGGLAHIPVVIAVFYFILTTFNKRALKFVEEAKIKKSGRSLKDGFRKSGPLGLHDGTYNEDYHYLGYGSELDECNGGIYNGKYVYFITDNYPRVPRCLYGEVSGDFNKSRH